MREALLAALLAGSTAHATVPQCDLALSLALDVSSSITAPQHAMVRKGTAEALRRPEIVNAMTEGGVYLQVFEWSDGETMLVDWTPVRNSDDLATIATAIEGAQRSHHGMDVTSMGSALEFALTQFERVRCARNVLDLMTDGNPTGGISPEQAIQQFDTERHQVNVLFVGQGQAALRRMETGVRFGWGSFVMPVPRWEDFGLGMYRKLLREVSMALTDGGTM